MAAISKLNEYSSQVLANPQAPELEVQTIAQLNELENYCHGKSVQVKKILKIIDIATKIIAVALVVLGGFLGGFFLDPFGGAALGVVGGILIGGAVRLFLAPVVFELTNGYEYYQAERDLRTDEEFIKFAQNQNANQDNILQVHKTYLLKTKEGKN